MGGGGGGDKTKLGRLHPVRYFISDILSMLLTEYWGGGG